MKSTTIQMCCTEPGIGDEATYTAEGWTWVGMISAAA
jgi:hypothetical protein